MKTAQQIIGLPVVSIFDGNEIGKVKNVIINASKGTIDFFIIDSGIRSLAGGVIPAERVLGIGEYALTIQQPDDISDIVKIPAAIELMQKNITVSGTRVLTKKGSLLGEAGDIYFDDESYNITGVEFVPATSTTPSGIIPRSSIITFGKNLLVVQDDFVEKLTQSPSAIEEVPGDQKKNSNLITDIPVEQEEAEILETITVPVEELKDDLFRIETLNPIQPEESSGESDLNILPENTEFTQTVDESSMSAAELFEHRQRQYLVGKRVTKTIYDDLGEVLVHAGDTITEYVIQLVKENGKLVDLVMNYED